MKHNSENNPPYHCFTHLNELQTIPENPSPNPLFHDSEQNLLFDNKQIVVNIIMLVRTDGLLTYWVAVGYILFVDWLKADKEVQNILLRWPGIYKRCVLIYEVLSTKYHSSKHIRVYNQIHFWQPWSYHSFHIRQPDIILNPEGHGSSHKSCNTCAYALYVDHMYTPAQADILHSIMHKQHEVQGIEGQMSAAIYAYMNEKSFQQLRRSIH